jgi:hypothetical protein
LKVNHLYIFNNFLMIGFYNPGIFFDDPVGFVGMYRIDRLQSVLRSCGHCNGHLSSLERAP